MKKELSELFPEELAAELTAFALPAYRVGQIFSGLQKGLAFGEISTLPLPLRGALAEAYTDRPVSILQKRVSKIDGTVKFLYALLDGNCVEGVLMRYRYGYTLCLSTQVGCRMGCAFCASTLQGCVRNLTAAEMLGQIHCAQTMADAPISNLVLMGSGEPLDNYDETVRFLRLVSHPQGLNIGLRHISLSTCGLAPQIRRFAGEGLPVTLSLSLHAPNDAIRRRLMPVARAYTIGETLDACRAYIDRTGRRVILEYALVKDVNSLPRHAAELASRLRGMQCHVNLIPLNSVEEKALRGADEQALERFMQELKARHISVTRRRGMGVDIDGACGQLRRRYLEEA